MLTVSQITSKSNVCSTALITMRCFPVRGLNGFPSQRTSNAKSISMSWYHYGMTDFSKAWRKLCLSIFQQLPDLAHASLFLGSIDHIYMKLYIWIKFHRKPLIYHNIPYFHLKLMNDGITEMSHDFCICFMTGVPGIWAQYVLLLAK